MLFHSMASISIIITFFIHKLVLTAVTFCLICCFTVYIQCMKKKHHLEYKIKLLISNSKNCFGKKTTTTNHNHKKQTLQCACPPPAKGTFFCFTKVVSICRAPFHALENVLFTVICQMHSVSSAQS